MAETEMLGVRLPKLLKRQLQFISKRQSQSISEIVTAMIKEVLSHARLGDPQFREDSVEMQIIEFAYWNETYHEDLERRWRSISAHVESKGIIELADYEIGALPGGASRGQACHD
ncbi:MAG: hypothetical protein IMZ71_05675 [Chloroflexi bacterium]|nr:hypothetical protein [Chloroflexota bacterium]